LGQFGLGITRTSKNTLVIRLQAIDEHTRPDHSYLDEDDECYYVLEYAARQKPPYDSTSDLIFNLKKPPDRRGLPEYYYKERDIQRAGGLLRSVLNPRWLESVTIVPIPCSKVPPHPLYDDRILQVLAHMTQGLACDIRELVSQTQSLDSFHDDSRLSPVELMAYYRINEELCGHVDPKAVVLFDDMLTTGSHFKAMKATLQDRWPDASICGVFIARRYFPKDEPSSAITFRPPSH
jgi:hypothetical protein